MKQQIGAAPTSPDNSHRDIDVTGLQKYLSDNLPDYAGPLSMRRFNGGQSNPTYLLETPDRSYVLRRRPAGNLLSSAHAVDREFRVMRCLHKKTSIPVPEPYLLCLDQAVIGSWFYVMEFVDGRIFWNTSFPEVAVDERRQYFDAMNATIAALHSVDIHHAGLSDFGRPMDYMSRQILRWSKQYAADEAAGRVPLMDELIAWLTANVPQHDEAALVHGDFRCDNLIFHPSEPRVVAIVDWELSTLGHPLADFAYNLMMYRMPTLMIPGLANVNLQVAGIPTEAEYVAAYSRRTGRATIDNLEFFLAFSFFRFAAILHGIRGRLARGTAASGRAAEYAGNVESVAELGLQQTRR